VLVSCPVFVSCWCFVGYDQGAISNDLLLFNVAVDNVLNWGTKIKKNQLGLTCECKKYKLSEIVCVWFCSESGTWKCFLWMWLLKWLMFWFSCESDYV